MKKIKIKRLSIKIILTLFLILLAITLFMRFLGIFIFKEQDQIDAVGLYLAVPGTGFFIILAFYYAINKIIVSRIGKLNDAVNEVVKGNFDININIKGSDELSKLTESFNSMTAELKANEYLSKEFVRNISHEFKTPLSAIRGYAELIESQTAENSLKEYASIIIDEADRLSSMSKSIIQLSLLDSTTLIKKEDSFCPSEQIRNILRLMHTTWENKNLEFNLKTEDFLIVNNEHLIYQVWQNLISNAIKFSGQNGKIKIILNKTEQGLYFEITDNGIGISGQDKDKIFTQFFVADKSRNTEGSGLGLPLVKKILEKLGGSISFESNEGKNTKFIVWLND